MKAKIKKWFFSGLLVVIPISLTIYILVKIVEFTDKLYPISYLPFYVPGFGIVITFCLIIFIGLITTNFLGKKLVSIGEKIIAKIPMVKVIYNSIKQISEAIFSTEKRSFRRVVLIEYPRKGVFTMAFVTGIASGEVQEKTKDKMLNVFVPTTPNPTSGFYLMVPEHDITELNLTVDEAFRLIISGGMASK